MEVGWMWSISAEILQCDMVVGCVELCMGSSAARLPSITLMVNPDERKDGGSDLDKLNWGKARDGLGWSFQKISRSVWLQAGARPHPSHLSDMGAHVRSTSVPRQVPPP